MKRRSSMSKTWIKHTLLNDELRVGYAVRKTVRNMAYNLENIITNLHGIVGDLHVLVSQIDSVANRMDSKNGMKVLENGHTRLSVLECSKDTKVLSSDITHWQRLIERCETPEFSPDLDWSYLGLSGIDRMHNLEEKLQANTFSNFADGYYLSKSDNTLDSVKTVIATPSDDCFAVSDGVGAHCNVPKEIVYSGWYEELVDEILENITSDEVDSDFSDDEPGAEASLRSSSSGSCSSVSSIEFLAEYDRQVNPWTTFNSVVNTLDSEDAFSVEDILNDNCIESKYFDKGFGVNAFVVS